MNENANTSANLSIDTLKSNYFEIQNLDSHFNQYYHLTSLYSAVIETYRSDLEKPYFKISYFSPERINHSLIDDENLLHDMANRPLHQHDFFELMFVLQGEAVVKIENTERVYPSGTGCIVNCNLRHIELLSNDFLIFFLNLSKEYLLSLFHSDNMFHLSPNTDGHAVSVFQFLNEHATAIDNVEKEYLDFFQSYNDMSSYKKLYRLSEEIVKETLSPQIGSSFYINFLVCQILDFISDTEHFHLSKVRIDYGNDFLIFTRLTHLLERSDGRLSRHELADSLSYSGDYLNRITKKYTGMTLFEYGTTFSLRKAEYYLMKTNYSVSEIVSMLNFTNKSHFYKLFFSKHHVTPKEYRSRYRS
ncbi:MAG: AraC family transcriptional regulator [Lachnospiraceae bacterium]|nr:AraC family transcriptional regulator [Lachnospiraceae bacterium]